MKNNIAIFLVITLLIVVIVMVVSKGKPFEKFTHINPLAKYEEQAGKIHLNKYGPGNTDYSHMKQRRAKGQIPN